MGDHYLLPGALTERSASARTEKHRLEYAASKREMCHKGWTGKHEERRREGVGIQADIILQPHFVVWERYDRMDPRRQRLGKKKTPRKCALPSAYNSRLLRLLDLSGGQSFGR